MSRAATSNGRVDRSTRTGRVAAAASSRSCQGSPPNQPVHLPYQPGTCPKPREPLVFKKSTGGGRMTVSLFSEPPNFFWNRRFFFRTGTFLEVGEVLGQFEARTGGWGLRTGRGSLRTGQFLQQPGFKRFALYFAFEFSNFDSVGVCPITALFLHLVTL